MSNTKNYFRIKFGLEEIFFLFLWAWLAVDSHPAWWLAFAAQGLLVFVHPRWSKNLGWRFRK